MGHVGQVALKKPSTLIALGNVFATPVPPVFSVEYQAVIDKATALGYSKPSLRQQILQNTLMQSWIASGAFAKADLIYMMANDAGLNFARINWKNPNSFLLTDVGADPVRFMSNYGPYTSPESIVFGALDSLWMPSQGVNFLLNDNCLISCTKSYYGGGGMPYRSAATGDQCTFYGLDGSRVFLNNNAVSASIAGAHNNFNWMCRRTAAAVSNLVYNNAGVITNNINSVNPSGTRNALKLGMLGDMHNALAIFAQSSPMEAMFVGGALTDPEFLNYDNALVTYLDSIRYVAGLFTTGNYTVPAGITQLFVECWGGGGAGRGYPNATATTTGGGGGGGAYAASLINVTPGQIIPFVIGAAGIGNATGAGGAGGDTSWNSGVILAKGGAGGPASTARAAGGLASASVGTIKYSGGLGGAGGAVLGASTASGGSAAGSLGNGVTGIDAVVSGASVRPFYNMLGGGPPGLSQGFTLDVNGSPGMMASGGGGARRTTVTKNGGSGGQGFIRVSAPRTY